MLTHNVYFKLNYIRTLLICSKMAFLLFQLRGKSRFPSKMCLITFTIELKLKSIFQTHLKANISSPYKRRTKSLQPNVVPWDIDNKISVEPELFGSVIEKFLTHKRNSSGSVGSETGIELVAWSGTLWSPKCFQHVGPKWLIELSQNEQPIVFWHWMVFHFHCLLISYLRLKKNSE